ncbi:hypothetical protein KEM56_005484 [Ascosphaera pollenicola]|nr:hypothetical protein KEM56_005484 [Ascosphaera pollenicola]
MQSSENHSGSLVLPVKKTMTTNNVEAAKKSSKDQARSGLKLEYRTQIKPTFRVHIGQFSFSRKSMLSSGMFVTTALVCHIFEESFLEKLAWFLAVATLVKEGFQKYTEMLATSEEEVARLLELQAVATEDETKWRMKAYTGSLLEMVGPGAEKDVFEPWYDELENAGVDWCHDEGHFDELFDGIRAGDCPYVPKQFLRRDEDGDDEQEEEEEKVKEEARGDGDGTVTSDVE